MTADGAALIDRPKLFFPQPLLCPLCSPLVLVGSRDHSRAYLSKARGHERTVIGYVYSPAAVGLIERELRSREFRRCVDHPESESADAG